MVLLPIVVGLFIFTGTNDCNMSAINASHHARKCMLIHESATRSSSLLSVLLFYMTAFYSILIFKCTCNDVNTCLLLWCICLLGIRKLKVDTNLKNCKIHLFVIASRSTIVIGNFIYLAWISGLFRALVTSLRQSDTEACDRPRW